MQRIVKKEKFTGLFYCRSWMVNKNNSGVVKDITAGEPCSGYTYPNTLVRFPIFEKQSLASTYNKTLSPELITGVLKPTELSGSSTTAIPNSSLSRSLHGNPNTFPVFPRVALKWVAESYA